jgi:hypothetical protein
MALRGMWGSMFSRKAGPALRLPRRFRSQLELLVGNPVPAAQVSASDLEQRVRGLLSGGAETGAPHAAVAGQEAAS